MYGSDQPLRPLLIQALAMNGIPSPTPGSANSTLEREYLAFPPPVPVPPPRAFYLSKQTKK